MSRSRDNGALLAQAGSRMEPQSELTDEQWLLIKDLFPEPAPSANGGRPRAPTRPCVEGILWILRSGARWKDLPTHFPSPSTCWRRFDAWTQAGIWQRAWSRLLRRLDSRGQVDTDDTIADGTFASAKKGANASARPNAAKAPRSWCIATETAFRWASISRAPAPTK
jgi:transposase